ncbi:MAG: acyl-CoA synthetase [Thermoplasmata archaeon]|nr:acyl-CoA synthetase [Thermoplasmata archaeon]MBE3136308.1 acyl-CoA synthetase [Thermoplasmata archaeon]MBE3140331.1 acyl-CoA synthetase [Thermoplasmata archaeon]
MGDFEYEKTYKAWKWDIPKKYNIGADVVDKHAALKNRNKVALYWENAAGETAKYTFGDLKNLSNKFGNALKKIGFKKGDRFLIRLPNIPAFQISFLGGVKIGAVPIPSSVMFREHEIEYRMNDSSAKAVITTPKFVKEVHAIKKNCKTLEHIIVVGDAQTGESSYDELMKGSSSNLDLEPTKSTDIAFFCYTSGTTGNPKGAVHLHRWVPGNDPSVIFWQNALETDIVAHTGDLNWIYPLGNGFLYTWRWGISTFVYDGKFDPVHWFELMEKYRVTNLASVPTAYRMFLTIKDAEKTYDLSALRHCISAGEPLNPEVIKEWKRRFGLDAHDGIGMTEVMVYLSNMRDMKIKLGSCGKPQPGHICALLDENGKPVPVGETGVLAVKKTDPGLFKEYWNKPEKTQESFSGDWFLSGDVLYQDEEGYYWFSGRNDDLIKASGYRISPFEVESAIISHPQVLECAVVASPDPMRGTIIKAYVVLRDRKDASENMVKEIQEHTKKVAAPYKYPREIEFVTELPKTQSGKIKRKDLRELERQKKGVLK